MNPSDATCIFSTLKFVKGSDLNNIVLRLGGFHTEMSFLGAIGHLMAGSGLQEIMELIYATNAVGHMMTGKAISRAVRAHLLVDGVLNELENCLPTIC
ncbi:hypothetical protein MAR_015584 [Mya arenaria]|uniref:Uncharacterized protein n=1 Tax=Mya arenaria TaxID=6604 RepID=A0ABY7FHG8_MYAAR|nr:hypothetical protein MAR_015584 [Mya arenaria]